MTTNEDLLAQIQDLRNTTQSILTALDRQQRGSFSKVLTSNTTLATDVSEVNTNVTATGAGVTAEVETVGSAVADVAEGLGALTPTSISAYSPNSIGPSIAAISPATPVSGTISTANSIYVPFFVSRSVTVASGFVFNGATVDGNVDIGVYDSEWAKIASTGATAQAGTNSIQTIAMGTPTEITPGVYYMALFYSSNTATFFRYTDNSNFFNIMGVRDEPGGTALPATATPSSLGVNTPVFGVNIEL